MKVRIAVAVDPSGAWNASGWGNPSYVVMDEQKMSIAITGVDEGESRYWIEAEIPDPKPTLVTDTQVIPA